MDRIHEGRLVSDPHEQRAETQAQRQHLQQVRAQVAETTDSRTGRRYESPTVREAVLAASERGNGPSPAREVQARGRRW